MAKKRTNTLSDGMLADVREMRRRILSAGNAPGSSRPFGASGSGPLYFLPTSQVDDGTGVSRLNYTGTLHTTPAGAAISSTTVKGRNIKEARNTSTVRAGLTVTASSTTCGDVIGIEPARLNVPYLVLRKQVIGGVTYYLFDCLNDPKIKRP